MVKVRCMLEYSVAYTDGEVQFTCPYPAHSPASATRPAYANENEIVIKCSQWDTELEIEVTPIVTKQQMRSPGGRALCEQHLG